MQTRCGKRLELKLCFPTVKPLLAEIVPRGEDEGGGCGVELSRGGKNGIREMGYVKMSFCEKCADGTTMEKEIEIAAKTR